MGAQFWSQSGYWKVASLLLASGHGDTLVSLYDASDRLSREGPDTWIKIALPETIIALRKVGRGKRKRSGCSTQYRQQLKAAFQRRLLGRRKAFSDRVIASLTGDKETAIRTLGAWAAAGTLSGSLHIPAMALRYDPTFGWLARDPRFAAIEDRFALAINVARRKSASRPLSREAWNSDPRDAFDEELTLRFARKMTVPA